MKISEHLNKDNLHHAYLIEGVRGDVVPEILSFLESIGVSVVGNPDFYHISTDSFKIDDARNLKSLSSEMSFTNAGKRIFIISANSFLLEAQNTMLKMFEEPRENTHFFIIVPSTDILLQTLISRFYLIRHSTETATIEAKKFIAMSPRDRIEFIKTLLTEVEEEDEDITMSLDSTRTKALKFLNSIEVVLENKIEKVPVDCFKQIFKVREFLRMPGSSTKSLMESVALLIPVLQ
ncbi:MAG: hypothetical protein KBC06_01210 [Candidatus Pacebacteria bacterium]|nr:hypothetical protein [Candidatus Paceibacterota bacterium]